MKKLLYTLIFFSLSLTVLADETKTYFRADYGLGKFKTDKLDSLNANPDGSTIGLAFGSRMSYVEFGAFYRSSSFESDITHDNVANKISHDGKTFGLDLNVFLNNHLSLKLGYAFHTYKQKLGTSVNAATFNAIKTRYGLKEEDSSSNIFYGANVDVFGSKSFDIYASLLHFPMGSDQSETTAQLGIRFYMNSSFADFFGAN